MKADTSLRGSLLPRGLALCSGEIAPRGGTSSYYRRLILHLHRGEVKLDKISQAQAQKDLLPQAMRGYLEYLAPLMPELPKHLVEDFDTLRNQARKDSKVREKHKRLDEVVAHLFLSLNLFFRFALSQGVISQKESQEHLLNAWKIFIEITDEQAKAAKGEEPLKRFFAALLELIAQGRIYFANMEDIPKILDHSIKIGWGPDESGTYYLLLGPALEQVAKFLRAQEESLSISKNDLLNMMEQEELLGPSQGGRRVIKKKIDGQEYRVLPVLEKAFKMEEEA